MKKNRGFSLIEVMIVVLIIGVISAIAYPVYQQYVLRSYRAEAKRSLQEAAQWMERNYSLTQTYLLQANGTTLDAAALTAQPFAKVPAGATGGALRYNISFSAGPAANTFTLQAVPANNQAVDKCGTFSLTSTQQRNATGPEGTVSCWSR
jgi:type IV pilus assembly protein PilE